MKGHDRVDQLCRVTVYQANLIKLLHPRIGLSLIERLVELVANRMVNLVVDCLCLLEVLDLLLWGGL